LKWLTLAADEGEGGRGHDFKKVRCANFRRLLNAWSACGFFPRLSYFSRRCMYHMVRFFDRKKIVRRLQRAEKVRCHPARAFYIKCINCVLKEQAALEEGDKKAVRKSEKVVLNLRFVNFVCCLLV
jgi:hypothetical protein